MTNLQQGGSPFSGPLLRRLWFGLPIAAGGLVALLLSAFVLVPQWLALRNDTKRLEELEDLQRDTALMRAQLRATEVGAEKAEAQQARLFEIVSGSGDLSTFMAMADREAGLAGVQLDLFEPQSGAAPAPGAAATPPKPPAPTGAAPGSPQSPPAAGGKAGAIEIAGLQRRSILLTARGSFPALLDFLRRLERLNVLVVQSDLRLVLEESKAPTGRQAPSQTPVLKVLLSLYERPTPAQPGAPPGAAQPGAPPGAAPGSAAAPPPAGSPAAPAQAPAR